MINIDDRLLPGIDESELFLLCHITKRLNKEMFCFPSNRTLMEETNWGKEKLQKVKKSLIDKGYLAIENRFIDNVQTSNICTVTTDLIGCYVGADKLSNRAEKPTPPREKHTPPPGAANTTTMEVLTRDEVLNTDSNESVFIKTSEYSGVNTEKKEKKVAGKKKEKSRDVCYPDFVKAWTEAFPTLGFDAVSGSKIKSMIAHSRAIVKERTDAGVGNSELSEEQKTLGIFQYILDYVKRTNHWCQGKSITTFESKYREIYTEVIHGKPIARKKESARDYINSLRQSNSHR
jgi:hypothetical protein